MAENRRKRAAAGRGAARAAKRAVDTALPEIDAAQLEALRQLFWHNIVREILGGLIAVASKRPELLDGRFAILTHGGERIPIAQVTPLFGFTVRGSESERQTSAAIQMTVFRVATPDGEVFTLPVTEIRAFHELTPELLSRLQQAESEAARAAGDENGESRPFGFAAFQALPKVEPAPMRPASADPME